MIYFLIPLVVLAAFLVMLVLYSRRRAREINTLFPPLGQFQKTNDLSVHYVDKPAANVDAPVVVFLHGASGNLRDPYFAFGERLDGKVRQIFIDRPGHGWSERGKGDFSTPLLQARHILSFLDALGVERAIFVGHSWSAVLAMTLGIMFPARVSALVLNAPVSHPWPGGINWYYNITALPVIGRVFAHLFSIPVGERQLMCATQKVFWPNKVPSYYYDDVGAGMVLVPSRFIANACDIARLRDFVVSLSPRYAEVKAPVTLITNDKDQVVLPWVHSDGLQKAVPHIKRIDLKNTGHMPHHAAPDVFVEEILLLAKQVCADQNENALELEEHS
ncbi:MAG: alpha/beta hydrolase [Hyphomicrobiales bacterium]